MHSWSGNVATMLEPINGMVVSLLKWINYIPSSMTKPNDFALIAIENTVMVITDSKKKMFAGVVILYINGGAQLNLKSTALSLKPWYHCEHTVIKNILVHLITALENQQLT